MNYRKGQAWGFDLIVGLMIFLVGMILFFLYVLNVSNESEEVFSNMNFEGKIVGDSLLSDGFPENWEADDVIMIGIMTDGKLNETKLLRFYDMTLTDQDYEKTRRLFNILNNYYIYFEETINADGTDIDGIGRQEVDPKNLVRISRVIVHEGKIKNLNIHIWN
jgi:hypothetical protein